MFCLPVSAKHPSDASFIICQIFIPVQPIKERLSVLIDKSISIMFPVDRLDKTKVRHKV